MQFPFGRLQGLETIWLFWEMQHVYPWQNIWLDKGGFCPSVKIMYPACHIEFHGNEGFSTWISPKLFVTVSFKQLWWMNTSRWPGTSKLSALPSSLLSLFVDWPSIGQIQGCQQCYYAAKSDFFSYFSLLGTIIWAGAQMHLTPLSLKHLNILSGVAKHTKDMIF